MRYPPDTGQDRAAATPGTPTTTRRDMADRQGTVIDVLNADGAEVAQLTYDAYGNMVSQTEPAEQSRFGFQGMEIDAAAGHRWQSGHVLNGTAGHFSDRRRPMPPNV